MGKSTTKKESKKAAEPVAVKPAKVDKKAADKQEKKSKKKQPEPESESSESESESEASDSDSDSSSASEAAPAVKAPKANGKKEKAAPKKEESSDSESESDSGSDSDSDSDESASEKEVKKEEKKTETKKESSDSDSGSDSDSDSSESEAEAEEAKEEEAPSKKRKALDDAQTEFKKARTDGSTTLFAGSLSWNVDDDALYEAFKEFSGLTGARVVIDKIQNRSRGFGYVDFDNAEDCTKAYEAMQGKEIDGRAINLDYANSKPADSAPADRANSRAQKFGDSVSPESDTLFVGNLPFSVDQDSVRAHFAEVAEVASIRLPTDMDSGRPKGFGYVTFNSVEDAKSAFNQLNGSTIGDDYGGRPIRLDYAGARPPQQGGGGGGFGGRGGGRGGRGGFGDRGGRGGGRGGFGDRGGRGGFGGRGGRGGAPRGGRGGASSFSGTKMSFD